MQEIIFVTHNQGKIASAQQKLNNVKLSIFEYELDEPRSDDIEYISKMKVMEAYELVKKPCISLDCGFWIDALNGFPKAFVNFGLETIGIEGIIKLMEGVENRSCRFTECLSYYDGKQLHQFAGKHEGFIAPSILGKDTAEKWSELWYIFIPKGYDQTLAQMTKEEREDRVLYDSIDSIEEFSNWCQKQLGEA